MRASPSDALGRQLGAASSQPAFWPRTNVTPNGIDPWLQTRPGYGLHQTRPSTTVPKRTRSDEPNALHHDDPRRRPSSSPQKRPLAGRSPAPQNMALGEFDRPATAGMSSDHRSIFGAEEDSKALPHVLLWCLQRLRPTKHGRVRGLLHYTGRPRRRMARPRLDGSSVPRRTSDATAEGSS